jgi:FKBP-type peptidyl-prolyl cis-trans isomerase FkpA
MKKILLFSLAATLLLTACNKFEKAPSGMPYKVEKGPRQQKLAHGQLLKMHFEYTLKDSVISSTMGHIPVYFALDTTRSNKYSFSEVMTDCYVGDKLFCTLSIDSMVKYGYVEYNPIFKKGDFLNCKVEFLKTFKDEAEQEKDFKQELEIEKKRQDKMVKDFAAKNKLQPIYTENGIGIVIETVGDTAFKANSGMQASVFYTGRIMETGKEFDSNVKNGVKAQPFSFIVDGKMVIPGWDEAIKHFAKGGKGKILIPAMMGYGAQGSPPVIAPYSNLVFDIEIADVKPAPQPVPQQPQAKVPVMD